jgi:hypothetical protein
LVVQTNFRLGGIFSVLFLHYGSVPSVLHVPAKIVQISIVSVNTIRACFEELLCKPDQVFNYFGKNKNKSVLIVIFIIFLLLQTTNWNRSDIFSLLCTYLHRLASFLYAKETMKEAKIECNSLQEKNGKKERGKNILLSFLRIFGYTSTFYPTSKVWYFWVIKWKLLFHEIEV